MLMVHTTFEKFIYQEWLGSSGVQLSSRLENKRTYLKNLFIKKYSSAENASFGEISSSG